MTLVVLLSSIALVGLFLWFLHLERSGQEFAAVGTILSVLVVDAALYPGFDVAVGLFHPQLGTTSFRPYEVLIVVALAARLAAKGLPARAGTPSLFWVAFFGWVLLQALVGLYVGHPADLVAFEAKVVVYLGAMALAGTVPVKDLLGSRTMTRFITFAAVVALGMIVLDSTGFRRAWNLPGVPLEGFGRMGSDFASISLAVGTVAVGLSMARQRGRALLLIAAAPLILTAFLPSQRAVLISVAALVVAGPLALLFRSAKRRIMVSSAEVVLAGMTVVACLCLPWVIRGSIGSAPSLIVTERVVTAFNSPAKTQSAQDRILQYKEAWPLINERPLFGWGLGKTLSHFQPGPDEFIANNLTHNVFSDLLMRSGLVGFGLFAIALGTSLVAGTRTWWNHPSDEVAYLALACLIVIVGVIGKGTVESIFEKFRLAVLLGVFLGMLRSLVLAPPGQPEAPDQQDRLLSA